MEKSKDKEGKQKDAYPRNNQDQNAQVKGALKEIERELGRKLNKDDKEKLHRHISGWNYGYHEIIEEGVEILKK